MAKHRLWTEDDDPDWPEEDPDEEERTVRNMPPNTLNGLNKEDK